MLIAYKGCAHVEELFAFFDCKGLLFENYKLIDLFLENADLFDRRLPILFTIHVV